MRLRPLAVLSIAALAPALAGLGALACRGSGTLVLIASDDPGPEWIASRSDNICGLDDPALLSAPALVAYDTLLALTPEIRRIKEEQIDERSALGIQLRQRAADRVRDACEAVRVKQGYCSVWRKIRHRDGRHVPDVTADAAAVIQPPK